MSSRPSCYLRGVALILFLFAATLLQAQLITSVTPASGVAGTQITVAGQELGVPGNYPNSALWIGNVSARVLSWTGTQIVAIVPEGLPGNTDTVSIMTEYSGEWDSIYSNAVNWKILQPIISSMSPTQGRPGDLVTFIGSGFGATQNGSTVTLKGVSANVVSWSDTRVVVRVPAGSPSSNFVVRVPGLSPSSSPYYYVMPYIGSITPSSGPGGTTVTITGQDLWQAGPYQALFIDNIWVDPITWTQQEIVARVPSGIAQGKTIKVGVAWWDDWDYSLGTNELQFTVTQALAPVISAISPASGPPGTTVIVTGTNFGTPAASVMVLFNGLRATVANWSDTQITAFVPPDATSGPVTVVNHDLSSNGKDFAVGTSPTITSIQPTAGPVGTSVTISGSNFGTTPGTLAFNGIAATSTSWSDSEITTSVPQGATTGPITLRVGSLSAQSPDFTVMTGPTLTGISPTSGPVGTEITIYGYLLGTVAPPGTSVLIGGMSVAPTFWSDTSIRVVVPGTSAGGAVSVSLGGAYMSAGTFTVTGGGQWGEGGQLTLSPDKVSLVVGETRTLDAVGADGKTATGLPWSSSDINVVTLSTDDPPVLTAIATGTATVTAGNATAEVTVYAGPTLPEGTVKWRVAGDGSGTPELIPAVPSSEGVADVFAVYPSGKIQAITADGHLAWTATKTGTVMADFQGGFIDAGTTVTKFDGKTGQPKPSYALQRFTWSSRYGVNTDNTVFTIDGTTIVGLDPQTGQPKFSVPMQLGSSTLESDCPNDAASRVDNTDPWWDTDRLQLQIAGDGYLYVSYALIRDSIIKHCESTTDGYGLVKSRSTRDDRWDTELHLLRVKSTGESQDTILHASSMTATSKEAVDRIQIGITPDGQPVFSSELRSESWGSGSAIAQFTDALTNSDQGVIITWTESIQPPYSGSSFTDVNGNVTVTGSGPGPDIYSAKVTKVLNGQVASENTLQLSDPNDVRTFITPVLQHENGDYIASLSNKKVMAFNTGGEVKWIKYALTGAQPLYALADGSTVYREGTYGNAAKQLVAVGIDGNETLRTADPGIVNSWIGNAYRAGSTESLELAAPSFASGFAASANGNPGSGTAIPSIGAIYRRKIAELATRYIGNSSKWREGGVNPSVTCNIFVNDVLVEASDDTALQFPAPTRPPRTRFFLLTRIDAFLASDWANPTKNAGCWKMVPGGSDFAQPGDVLATGYPVGATNGTGHVGFVVEPSSIVASGYPSGIVVRFSSAASNPPYWWDPLQKASFVPGIITLTDYGFRLPGFDKTDPNNNQGLKKDSYVRRFSCY